MKRISPGSLNKRIEVLEHSQVPDGGGGYEDALVPIKKLWASINPIFGRELWSAQQTKAEVSHKIFIRYTEIVNRSHIISFNKKEYDIQYLINVNEANEFLEIHVLERQ